MIVNGGNRGTASSSLPQSRFGLGSDHTEMIVFMIRYFRIVSMVFFVWLVGYFNFSLSWILLAVMMYLLREKTRNARQYKADMIKAIGINEKDAIIARLDEVPSWVYFPDRERAEWVNKMLKQMWPNLRVYIAKTLTTTIEPIINQYSTAFIGNVKFDEIDLGDIPPRVGGIKVYTENVQNGEIMMDVEILYAGDAQIKLEFKKINAGFKDVQFHGEFRVILKPLCNRIPFAASMIMFLLKMPQIDFNLTQIANTLDLPGLRKLIDNTIEDVISKTLVLPNRLVIPLMADFDPSELDDFKTLKPRGVLRVHVVRGNNLKNKDISVLNKDKSDPYIKISGIGVPRLTKVCNNNLNPVWNETFDYLIDEISTSPTLLFQVLDKDDLNDDSLGSFDVSVDRIMSKRKEEGFYKLKGVSHGEIYLRFEWYYLTDDKLKLNKIRQLKEFRSNVSCCLLLIDLKSASELPFASKKSGGMSEPDPRVIFGVRDLESTTSTKPRTTNPKWNETHYFFINSPENERLACKIQDEKSKSLMATLDFSIAELLNEPNLSTDRSFNLTCLQAGYLPKLHMKLSLKILYPYKDNESESETFGSDASLPSVPEQEQSEQQPLLSTGNQRTANGQDNNTATTMSNRFGADQTSRPIASISRKEEKKMHSATLDNRSTASVAFSNNDLRSLASYRDNRPSHNGLIRLGMKYRLDESLFILNIYECKNLRMIHKTHLPDAYIKCYLMPDKKSKKKTRFVKDNLSPVFDERFQWNINLADLKKCDLLVVVKNHKFFFANEKVFIGQVVIELTNTEPETDVENWYELRGKDESRFFVDKIE